MSRVQSTTEGIWEEVRLLIIFLSVYYDQVKIFAKKKKIYIKLSRCLSTMSFVYAERCTRTATDHCPIFVSNTSKIKM